jgi:hypothetical protein
LAFGLEDDTTRRRDDEIRRENQKNVVSSFRRGVVPARSAIVAGAAHRAGICYFARDAAQFVVEPPDFADPSIRSPLTCPVYSVLPAVNVI